MADPEQPISEDAMRRMSVAPPEPEAKPTSGQVAEEEAAHSGVADEDPLSAHPS
jgi:hypothetical protein